VTHNVVAALFFGGMLVGEISRCALSRED